MENTILNEVVVPLAGGFSLRCGADEDCPYEVGTYVRLCNPDGAEVCYWDHQEWADNPELVMGAIMRSAAGYRVRLSASTGSIENEQDRHNQTRRP
jgi:hypothetical protein